MDLGQFIFDRVTAGGYSPAFANLVVAQARHETGDFTSNVSKNCLNLFGYKYVGQSGAVACSGSPEGDNYAKYSAVAGSVDELINWIRRRQKEGTFPPGDLSQVNTPEKYAQALKAAGYYGDSVSNYTSGLKRFLTNYGPRIAFNAGLALALGILVWYVSRKNVYN